MVRREIPRRPRRVGHETALGPHPMIWGGTVMKTFGIYENDHMFATVEARTATSALKKAAKAYPRHAIDYNGYVGPVTWRAGEIDATGRLLNNYFDADLELRVTETLRRKKR